MILIGKISQKYTQNHKNLHASHFQNSIKFKYTKTELYSFLLRETLAYSRQLAPSPFGNNVAVINAINGNYVRTHVRFDFFHLMKRFQKKLSIIT